MNNRNVARVLGLVLLMNASACNQGSKAEPGASPASADKSAGARGKIETAHEFHGPMPTGVTVSQGGRIFVNYPRWGDEVEFTVAEIKNGQAVAYPDARMTRFDPGDPADTFVSVQSVVVDPADRLWVLDTGSVMMGKTTPGGPKLVCIDLGQNKVVKKISFPQDVALPTTYLNDVRFDLRRGKGGTAYITDSSAEGPNGIIVVDLDSGRSWRKLNDHKSTKAEKDFVPIVEGQPLMMRLPGSQPQPITIGSDGIAISADGKELYYTPLASRRLYSVSTDLLADEKSEAWVVAENVKDLGDRGFASDGLETDASGRIYLTDYEKNAVRRRKTDGSYEFVAQEPMTVVRHKVKGVKFARADLEMVWPDTLSVAGDGYVYFICNQLNRQPQFHEGKDLREKPYLLLRTRVDAQPVRLK